MKICGQVALVTEEHLQLFPDFLIKMKLDTFSEEVVISGIGGYFPKCRNVEEFKTKLLNNENLLENRWPAGNLLAATSY